MGRLLRGEVRFHRLSGIPDFIGKPAGEWCEKIIKWLADFVLALTGKITLVVDNVKAEIQDVEGPPRSVPAGGRECDASVVQRFV